MEDTDAEPPSVGHDHLPSQVTLLSIEPPHVSTFSSSY